MTSVDMLINSTNFQETKHELVVDDGRLIKARATIMGLPGRLNANKFPSNPEQKTGMGTCYQLNIILNKN